METTMTEEVQEQARGVVGALLVLGAPVAFTMEVWWLAGMLPLQYLPLYGAAGLLVVFLVTQNIGFREEHEEHPRRSAWGRRRTSSR